jgi:hypothetical protein
LGEGVSIWRDLGWTFILASSIRLSPPAKMASSALMEASSRDEKRLLQIFSHLSGPTLPEDEPWGIRRGVPVKEGRPRLSIEIYLNIK